MTSTTSSAALKLGRLFTDDSQLWPAELCKGIIERSPWPMFVIDCQSRNFVETNAAALRKYKRSREVLLAGGVEAIVPPGDLAQAYELLDAGLDGPVREEPATHILPDGSTIAIEVTSFPLLWNGRPSRFAIVRDPMVRNPEPRNPGHPREPDQIPSRQLQPGQSPAAHSLPEFQPDAEVRAAIARPIAHDFNNLLTVILAIAEQLEAGEGDPEHQVTLLAKTIRAAQELAQDKLSQGHRQTARRERLDINAVLRNDSDLLGAVLGKHIHLHLQLDDDLWPVFADAGQWREVLLNLTVNARDAMPDGGAFYVSTRRALLTSDDPKLGLSHGRYAHLVIRDTGQGMTDETKLHAFEPYYTTKPREHNSGLGLASVLGIVHDSGGAIRLTSALGEGTRFDIFIPAQNEDIQTSPALALLLLVEDEDELRKLIQDFLTARGYEVIACGTGEAALKWARTLVRNPDVVISDMALPEDAGTLLVTQLRQQNPRTKVIFMSGYSKPRTAILGIEDAVYLQKPFSLHHLANILSEMLGTAAQPDAG